MNDMNDLIIVGWIVSGIVSGLLTTYIMHEKGRRPTGVFFVGLLLGPIAVIGAACSSDIVRMREIRKLQEEEARAKRASGGGGGGSISERLKY